MTQSQTDTELDPLPGAEVLATGCGVRAGVVAFVAVGAGVVVVGVGAGVVWVGVVGAEVGAVEVTGAEVASLGAAADWSLTVADVSARLSAGFDGARLLTAPPIPLCPQAARTATSSTAVMESRLLVRRRMRDPFVA